MGEVLCDVRYVGEGFMLMGGYVVKFYVMGGVW